MCFLINQIFELKKIANEKFGQRNYTVGTEMLGRLSKISLSALEIAENFYVCRYKLN